MKNILLFIGLLLFLPNLQGQKEERIYRHYGTQEVEARLLEENPRLQKEKSRIEKHIHQFRLVGNISDVIIPVVFHVLYNSPKEKISEEQVLAQLAILNQDFSTEITDFEHPAEVLEGFDRKKPNKIGIQFCLASIKGGNAPKSSINILESSIKSWSLNDKMKSTKTGGISPVNPKKYLNIWIVNLDGKNSGYAQMPGGPEDTDGIVIDYQFFSNPFNKDNPYSLGRTLTHLVGSYLGLYELWNNTRPCSDDYVTDTPIHNTANLGRTITYKHLSTCPGYQVEMSMNFMDNSDDAYQNLFTNGQLRRMWAVLSKGGPRHQLKNSHTECSEKRQLLGSSDRNSLSSLDADSKKQFIQMSVFPNPAKNYVQLQLKGKSKKVSLVIYDSVGNIVWQKRGVEVNGNQNISLAINNNWSSGIYFIHLHHNGKNKSHRFAVFR